MTKHLEWGWSKKTVDAIEMGIHALKETQWIPCSERLPEESLNSVIGWDTYRKRCCFVQYLNGGFVLGNGEDIVDIVAWMPVPEPYKGE